MNWVTTTWNTLADSLNSRGGTIALLFVSSFILGALLVHVMHHGDTGESASLIRNTFSGFVGALLLSLTGKDRPNGNNDTSNSTEHKKVE